MTPQRHQGTKIFGLTQSSHEPIPPEVESVASAVVDAAFKVHSALGPGLLESVYETCLCHELKKKSIPFSTQVAFPIVYDGLRLDAGLRVDLLIAKAIIVELKAVDQVHPVFEAQLLSYLKLTNLRLGLLINFNVPLIKYGIKRIIT
jgi:GxxExxY protein